MQQGEGPVQASNEVGMIIDSAPFRSPERRNAGGRSRKLAPVALAIALGAALAFGAGGPGAQMATAANPNSSPASGSGTGADVSTSISYQQALEHANDPNTFVPGDAVTVPYRPRAGDTTEVDGSLPVPLPGATASGRSMAASPQGSVWSTPDVTASTESTPAAGASAATVSPTVPAQGQATPAANVLRREVYGFLPYWESIAGPKLNYDILSTVAYFGVIVDSNGNLTKGDSGWAGWSSSWMTNVINAAHAHGTRVALTIESFAWTASESAAQVALLSSSANRLNAAKQIAASVSQRGADGVSLDFEPIASTEEADYVSFVRTLRVELDKIHPGYELTFCATGSTGYYDVAGLTAAGAADAVFIMGYDFRTGSSGYAGSVDPLTSPMPVYDLTYVVNLWEKWTSASKIILGLPYYGVAWSTTSNAPNATVLPSSGCAATSVFFAQAALLASTNGRNYDSVEQSPWTSYQLTCNGVATWRELYYDDAQSLGAKYDMINYWNLRGMGIWALGYDAGHPEMPSLVAAKFLNDKTPPKVGIVNLPASEADEGFPVSWTGQDDWNGIAGYDIQVSTDRGAFVDWLTGTTETTDNFQGSSGHNYSFRVRATDGVGNVGAGDVTSTYVAAPIYAIGGYISVVAASVSEHETASGGATVLATTARGTVLQIIGGPQKLADGLWYQVTGPVAAVNPVVPLFPGPWVATVFAAPVAPPNSTAVSAGITDYSVGVAGLLPSGTGIDRGKVFSPDGDGIRDTLPISWSDKVAFDDVVLTIYREDETIAGTIDLGARAAGPQTYSWNGTPGGSTPLPDGRYLIQVSATAGTATYHAPSAAPFGAGQLDRLGVVIDTTPSGTYYPLPPVRVLDTRHGIGLTGAFSKDKARSFVIAGVVPRVPSKAIAVTGNVTVTEATGEGWLRLGPSVTGTSSTINFKAGDNRANGVTLGLAADGSLSGLYHTSSAKGTVQVIFDLTGYFMRDANGTTFVPIAPTRIVDSRAKQGLSAPLAAGKIATFSVTGLAGVPSNAVAVSGNATITGQTGVGYITVAPNLVVGSTPVSSTVNFPVGDNRANNVTVPLSGGKLQVEYIGGARTTVQFIFDVTGYFVPGLSGATFVPLTPGRVVDSRSALGFVGPLKTGGTATFAVSGQVSIRPIAVAIVGNLTVTAQTSDGWLAAGPGPVTGTSTLNFPMGDNRANGFVSLLGPGGTLAVTFKGNRASTTQVVVDILGYYR
jgi:spore germination protein YaaH